MLTIKKTILASLIGASIAITGCSEQTPTQTNETAPAAESATMAAENPFFQASSLQYQAPDFRLIRDEHFLPAIERGMAEQLAEVEAIANNPEAPTFENTLVALERSGELLTRASRVFSNLTGTDSNEKRREIQSQMAPKFAGHSDNINLNAELFERIKTIYNDRENLGLNNEQKRLVEVYYQRFVRAGAQLTDSQKEQIRALNEEHSRLTNQFAQNLLAETRNIAVVVDTVAELDGLSRSQIQAAANAAADRGHEGKYLLSITNTTRQPILTSLNNREVRQRVWEASAYRAQSGDYDNRPISARLAQIRAERAALLGYDSWADYNVEPQMAQTPEAVFELFGTMLPTVIANVEAEQAAIQEMIERRGGDFEVQPWDWEYYAEFVRQELYDIDEAEVREYFEFNRVLHDGVFYTMNRFYGITFEPRPDLPTYHEDVEVYEVFDADGSSIGLFYADYFAREGKRGGAWMSSFVTQSHLLSTTPVVVNVMNIPKAPEGEPTLISYDHTTTIFHEIGHAIHGIFSNVTYPTLAGTAVSRDFVEFPSTFEEDWAAHPEIIANYAKHYETGEPIPDELLERIIQSRSFNQGFDTLEYISASLLDMEWHSLTADDELQDVNEFEAAALAKYGVDLPAVPPRYKTTFFSHSMGGGYSASYYAYMWSEILAADAFAYVQSQGGLTRENGNHYRSNILEVGNTRPTMESYIQFRGQEPTTDALLIRRGLQLSVD